MPSRMHPPAAMPVQRAGQASLVSPGIAASQVSFGESGGQRARLRVGHVAVHLLQRCGQLRGRAVGQL